MWSHKAQRVALVEGFFNWMHQSGLSQADLARLFQVSRSTIHRWFLKSRTPSPALALRLSSSIPKDAQSHVDRARKLSVRQQSSEAFRRRIELATEILMVLQSRLRRQCVLQYDGLVTVLVAVSDQRLVCFEFDAEDPRLVRVYGIHNSSYELLALFRWHNRAVPKLLACCAALGLSDVRKPVMSTSDTKVQRELRKATRDLFKQPYERTS